MLRCIFLDLWDVIDEALQTLYFLLLLSLRLKLSFLLLGEIGIVFGAQKERLCFIFGGFVLLVLSERTGLQVETDFWGVDCLFGVIWVDVSMGRRDRRIYVLAQRRILLSDEIDQILVGFLQMVLKNDNFCWLRKKVAVSSARQWHSVDFRRFLPFALATSGCPTLNLCSLISTWLIRSGIRLISRFL